MNQRSTAYDSETLIHFRKLIDEQLVGIRLSIEHNHKNEPQFLEELKSWEPETGERGVEWRKHLILNGQSEDRKNDLEAALERLNNGTYGFCEKCGEVIPFSRLEVILEAKYDLDCEVEVKKSKTIGIVSRRTSARRKRRVTKPS